MRDCFAEAPAWQRHLKLGITGLWGIQSRRHRSSTLSV